ncbi:MAG: mechanosensitive ion channel [Chlamydiales bacterium]|nr:mechanosensitive ion channel [Chlamydiia bacterium]MCP5505032.1 mechanosensitive ion channel [Chlamydiales bacterium]
MMEWNDHKSLFLEFGSLFLALISGAFFSFFLRKKVSIKLKKLQRILTDSTFVFFLGIFLCEILFLPVLTFTFQIDPSLNRMALFILGVLICARLVRIFSKSIGGYLFTHLLGWTAFIFYFLGLLHPIVMSLQKITFKLGATTFTLLGILKACSTTALLIWLALIITRYFEKRLKKQTHLQPSLRLLFSKALKTLLIAFSLYIGLTLLGVDLSAFSIFAGAIGVGIAFGLQNILSNFFSGFIILMDRSIKPGDVISLNNGEIYGVVNRLHARYVSVRTREGKEHLIPNQEIISHKLENWSFTDPFIRMEIPFRVSFDSDLELVQKLLVDIAKVTDRVMNNPAPYIRFRSMVDNAVELKLRVWVRDPENGTSGIQSDIILEAWKAFKAHGIRVPYPPREIFSRLMDSEKEVFEPIQN